MKKALIITSMALSVPFFALAGVICLVSIVVDLAGAAVAFVCAAIVGEMK